MRKYFDIIPPIKNGDIIHLDTKDIYDYKPPQRIIDLRTYQGIIDKSILICEEMVKINTKDIKYIS